MAARLEYWQDLNHAYRHLRDSGLLGDRPHDEVIVAIIDADGRCWCGQVWDGEKMCFQASAPQATEVSAKPTEPPETA